MHDDILEHQIDVILSKPKKHITHNKFDILVVDKKDSTSINKLSVSQYTCRVGIVWLPALPLVALSSTIKFITFHMTGTMHQPDHVRILFFPLGANLQYFPTDHRVLVLEMKN